MEDHNFVKPNISDYLDYRKFMIDSYNFKKRNTKKFSYSRWAEKAGFKSRSFLRLVMLGERSLSSDSIRDVAKALELNKQETEFFFNLVSFNQSENFKNREFYLSRLMKTNVAKKIVTIKDSYRFLTNPLTPRVQILLAVSGIEKTPERLAKILRASVLQVNQALESLKSLGLAYLDETNQQWNTQTHKFSLPDSVGNIALQSFHQKSLDEAKNAMTLPSHTRHYSSVLLVLSESEYQALVKEYDDFEKSIMLKYSITDGKNKRVYQLNKNLIPVSEILTIVEHKTSITDPSTSSEFTDETTGASPKSSLCSEEIL